MNNTEDMENPQVVFPLTTMYNKPQNEKSEINIVRNFRMLIIQTWRQFTVSRDDEYNRTSNPLKLSGNFTLYQMPTQCIYIFHFFFTLPN
jgi:hypothetical protein